MPKPMKKSVELSVRASEIKSEINALDPGDGSLEKRRELHGNLNTVESGARQSPRKPRPTPGRPTRRV